MKMKNVTFKFADGYTETFAIPNAQINPYSYRMAGVASAQNNSIDPQDWVDYYNDWSVDEGNNTKEDGVDCIGFEVERDETAVVSAHYNAKSDTYVGCVERFGQTFPFSEKNADELIKEMTKYFPSIKVDYDYCSRKFSITY